MYIPDALKDTKGRGKKKIKLRFLVGKHSTAQLNNFIFSTDVFDQLNDSMRAHFFSSTIVTAVSTGLIGPKRDGNGEGSTMRNFIVCTVHLI